MTEIEPGPAATEIPLPAILLGGAGLLPFAFGAAALVLTETQALPGLPDADYFAKVLIGYGAVILSFLGGVRWGAAMIHDEVGTVPRSLETINALTAELVIAILPALIAWGALLLPIGPALAILAISFIAMGIVDRMASRDARLPAWYATLRLWLTAGATTSVLTGLAAFLFIRA